MKHGIYIIESPSAIQPTIQTDSICVAVGVAPIQNKKITLCNSFSEFQNAFGYSEDFQKYSLCEAAKFFFNLYNISPVVFLNVLSDKHSTEISNEIEGKDVIRIEGDIISDSIVLTSGEFIPANKFTSDDFEIVGQTETITDEDTGEETSTTVNVLTITNIEKIVDNKINLKYRVLSTALGGKQIEQEVDLTDSYSFELPEDIMIESIEIESGGVDTLRACLISFK